MPPRTPQAVTERRRRDLLATYVTAGRKSDADAMVKHWSKAQRDLTDAETAIADANTALAEMGVHWSQGESEGDGWREGFPADRVYRSALDSIEDFVRDIRREMFDDDDESISEQTAERLMRREEDEAIFAMDIAYEAQKAMFEHAWTVARACAKKYTAQSIHERFTRQIQKGKEEQARKEEQVMGALMSPTPRRVPTIKNANRQELTPPPAYSAPPLLPGPSDSEEDDYELQLNRAFSNETLIEDISE